MCERVQLLENSGKSRKNGEKIRGCQNHGLKKKLEMETIEYRNLRCQWFFDEKNRSRPPHDMFGYDGAQQQ